MLSTILNGDLWDNLTGAIAKINASITAVNTLYPNTSAYYQDYSAGNFEPTITGSNITLDYCKYSYIKQGTSLNHLRLFIGFNASAGNTGYGDLTIIIPIGFKAVISKSMLIGTFTDNSSGNVFNMTSDSSGNLKMLFDSGSIPNGQHIVTMNVTYELQ